MKKTKHEDSKSQKEVQLIIKLCDFVSSCLKLYFLFF